MTLDELCGLFDRYEIVESQIEIDRELYTPKETIFTDGDYKSNITGNGYIHITCVKNATYLMLVDVEYKTYLRIYKYISDSKFKYIKQKLQFLKDVVKESDEYSEIMDNRINAESTDSIDKDVIDINEFTCECGSKEQLVFARSKTNYEALETKCKECKSEYVFVPSKYYKLASKRTIYFKSEDSSRKINILNKTNDKDLK